MKTIKGVVHWYDKHSKRGCIISLDGIWYRIHEFTKIEFPIKENDHITFRLEESSIKPIVRWVKKSKKKYKLSKKKKTPKVSFRKIQVVDQFSGRIVILDGYHVSNYHWLEVRDNDDKIHAVQGLFSTPEGPIHMWNGTWEKYCGYENEEDND